MQRSLRRYARRLLQRFSLLPKGRWRQPARARAMHSLDVVKATSVPLEEREVVANAGQTISRVAPPKALFRAGPTGNATTMLPERGEVTVGRAADCDLHVDDVKASPRHGVLRIACDDVDYVDLGSLNGSFIHDVRLLPGARVRLAPGDPLRIGDTVLFLLRSASFGAPGTLVARPSGMRLREATEADVDTGAVVLAGALGRMDLTVDQIATSQINVLLLGETGVGKDVLARRIHERSPRARHPMVSINCAALSESLLESELFGHEKGAFTGALTSKAGLFEAADGGTVFLDEIGEMPLATQAKLLRVLEQREVTRVGAVRPRPVDVRFIAATNRRVEEDVATARFRADLYFRINGISLPVPPLRERVDEIEPLARAFVDGASRAMNLSRAPRLSAESLAVLHRYSWPGNIRELRNVIERAVLLSGGASVIAPGNIHLDNIGPSLPAASRERPASTAPPLQRAADGMEDERARVVQALERCAWNQAHAAKALGISRGTLIKRIVLFGLPRPRKRS